MTNDKSLREEINNRLTFLTETKSYWEYDNCTKDIVEIIEKRIDDEIKHITQKPELYPVSGEFRITCLKDVKEMLK